MNKNILVVLFFLNSLTGFSQSVISGRYSNGLNLAFDSTTNLLTGYYENYTGMNEDNSAPLFSCVFYLSAIVDGDEMDITTHYPNDIQQINGKLKIVSNTEVEIYLTEEHGGCFNVQHFTDEPVKFTLEERNSWKQIKYVISDKAYIYKGRKESDKLKSFLIEKDVFFIDKMEAEWSYGTFFGATESKGWLKNTDLFKTEETLDERLRRQLKKTDKMQQEKVLKQTMVAHSADNRVWIKCWDENTGGSFKSNSCIIVYKTDSGKMVVSNIIASNSDKAEVQNPCLNVAYYDKIYKLNASANNLYLLKGSVQGCNTCCAEAFSVVELVGDKINYQYPAFESESNGNDENSFKPCFLLDSRCGDIEYCWLNPAEQSIYYSYITDDNTPVSLQDEKINRVVGSFTFNGEQFIKKDTVLEILAPMDTVMQNANTQDAGMSTGGSKSIPQTINVKMLKGIWEEVHSKNLIYLMDQGWQLILTDSASRLFYFDMDSLSNVNSNGFFPQWPPPSCQLELMDRNTLKISIVPFGSSGFTYIYTRRRDDR